MWWPRAAQSTQILQAAEAMRRQEAGSRCATRLASMAKGFGQVQTKTYRGTSAEC